MREIMISLIQSTPDVFFLVFLIVFTSKKTMFRVPLENAELLKTRQTASGLTSGTRVRSAGFFTSKVDYFLRTHRALFGLE